MDLGLKDKNAVVLASTAGLGFAVAEALAQEGARVEVSGRDEKRLAGALGKLGGSGDRVHGENVDVTDLDALRSHLDGVSERWGGIDILVTNGGGPAPGAAEAVTAEDVDSAYQSTLRSAMVAVQHVLPGMKQRGWGRIVGMTSSSVRQPIANLALSNTLRAGLTGWLKTLAFEVASSGVLVNTICTGMFQTERLEELFEVRASRSGRTPEEEKDLLRMEIPVERIGDPREFGAMVAFMVSEKASFLNGVALPYDGGAGRSLL